MLSDKILAPAPSQNLLHMKMPKTPPQLGSAVAVLGQMTPEATVDLRAEAVTTAVGLAIALFGSSGKKEPIMIIVGSIIAGIGGAGLISGLVKYASR